MLPYLTKDSPFPETSEALDDPNGLLAAGADLSPERLIEAYSKGIFPWFSGDEPILWWSPDPRTVFVIEQFKTNKSVIKTLKKLNLTVTLNNDFEQVITQCSAPRISQLDKNAAGDESATWITPAMKSAYLKLHQLGFAHSVEVWQHQKLVGGIYGVACGSVFCGESMFSLISNGSKIALSSLIHYLKDFRFELIDCQVENPHLMQLGAINISRQYYLDILASTKVDNLTNKIWLPQKLDWCQFFQNKATC